MFITFEGLDGCGKSTICSMLCEYLKSKGIDTVNTFEPGGTIISNSCRDILLNSNSLDDRAELMLFLAARAQHVKELIEPNLIEGKWVICDRYIDSFIAYQSFGRGFDFTKLQEFNDFACYGIYPDKTFYLDIDLGSSLDRERVKDRISSSSIDFYSRIKEGFDLLCEQYPERIIKIDARKTVDNVLNNIIKHLDLQGI